MAIELVVPNLGEGGMDIAFAGWLKAEGDMIVEGDDVFEIDTDKVTVSVQAYASGVLADLRVQAGDVVQRGQVVALLAEATNSRGSAGGVPRPENGDDLAATASVAEVPGDVLAETSPSAAQDEPAPARKPMPAHESGREREGRRLSPRARRASQRLGVATEEVTANRPDGCVVEADVLEAARSRSAERRGQARQAMATLSSKSWSEIPHLQLQYELDITGGMSASLGIIGLVGALIVGALEVERDLLVEQHLVDSGRAHAVHLGLMLNTVNGTLLGRVPHCERSTRSEIARRLRELKVRTRTGLLRPQDYGPRSATLYDFTDWPVDAALGVIALPDPILVTVGRPRVLPRFVDGSWQPASVVTMGLALDHRVYSGADGGRLLDRVDRLLGAWREDGASGSNRQPQ